MGLLDYFRRPAPAAGQAPAASPPSPTAVAVTPAPTPKAASWKDAFTPDQVKTITFLITNMNVRTNADEFIEVFADLIERLPPKKPENKREFWSIVLANDRLPAVIDAFEESLAIERDPDLKNAYALRKMGIIAKGTTFRIANEPTRTLEFIDTNPTDLRPDFNLRYEIHSYRISGSMTPREVTIYAAAMAMILNDDVPRATQRIFNDMATAALYGDGRGGLDYVFDSSYFNFERREEYLGYTKKNFPIMTVDRAHDEAVRMIMRHHELYPDLEFSRWGMDRIGGDSNDWMHAR